MEGKLALPSAMLPVGEARGLMKRAAAPAACCTTSMDLLFSAACNLYLCTARKQLHLSLAWTCGCTDVLQKNSDTNELKKTWHESIQTALLAQRQAGAAMHNSMQFSQPHQVQLLSFCLSPHLKEGMEGWGCEKAFTIDLKTSPRLSPDCGTAS